MEISANASTYATSRMKDIIKNQHPIHARNGSVEIQSTRMQDLVSQLNDKLGGEVQISVQNVPGNEAAVKRYAAGCESGCSIALAPNQANKLLKDPGELENWVTKASEYLDQLEEAGEGSTRTGIVFTANGEVKTWAFVESNEQADTEVSEESGDETEDSGSGLAGIDYQFKSEGNILKHMMKNSWMILPAWDKPAEEEAAAASTEPEPSAVEEIAAEEPAELSETDSQ